ncbi:glycosyltransferase family 2 protein [Butyrivibrio fibrisolvens]|uniref:glycosyltransferase family 2 protein n=1 Tax=Butyrivibrio fibrisolvens TaxID=831 RepID=UPI00040E591D|nr:glycosyltransferase [Butyrivibrio fibrisolvens]
MSLYKREIFIGFVTVNYGCSDSIMKLIDSIYEHIDTTKFCIVIVDNCSQDNSGQFLSNKYESSDEVHVIFCDKNLGFAKGNNEGISFLRNLYDCEFICLANPDTRIVQDDFCERLDEDYIKYKFDVLGPKKINGNGIPYFIQDEGTNIITIQQLEKRKRRVIIWRKLIFLYYVYTTIKDRYYRKLVNDEKGYKINVQLSGCFLVLASNFFSHYNGLFPNTFLFMEEEILYKMVMEYNGITVYSPQIVIVHEKGISRGRGINKLKLTLDETINSMDRIIEYLHEHEYKNS